MQLASSFRYGSPMLRANSPLSDDQIRRVAPSIFADGKHESRSEHYTYIPTIDVLRGLRNEGFQPFMVCQTRVRHDDRREYTKHMLRLRHADQITGEEANEIVLLNSHDGTSSYQMLAGMLRFVCQNGRSQATTSPISASRTRATSFSPGTDSRILPWAMRCARFRQHGHKAVREAVGHSWCDRQELTMCGRRGQTLRAAQNAPRSCESP